MKKFELTTNTQTFLNKTLYQIRAMRSFGDVRAGDLGGWVEKEKNLSHEGNAWIYGDAMATDDSNVRGDAKLSGNAWISEQATVTERSRVFGNARMMDNSGASGNALIFDNAYLHGNAWATNNVRVFGSAKLLGNTAVYDNSIICGKAFIKNIERIEGNACISKTSDIMSFNGVGSSCGILTAMRASNGGILIMRGCFHGTIDEFAAAVEETHGASKFGSEYRLLVQFIRLRMGEAKNGG